VRELIDFSVYLDISDEVKIAWKIQRDMEERGHRYEDVMAAINPRRPDFNAYIEPQRICQRSYSGIAYAVDQKKTRSVGYCEYACSSGRA